MRNGSQLKCHQNMEVGGDHGPCPLRYQARVKVRKTLSVNLALGRDSESPLFAGPLSHTPGIVPSSTDLVNGIWGSPKPQQFTSSGRFPGRFLP